MGNTAVLDPFDVESLGNQLAHYVTESRSLGPNTSLVVFTRPGRCRRWTPTTGNVVRRSTSLRGLDKSAWPDTIPEQIDHPMWEFFVRG